MLAKVHPLSLSSASLACTVSFIAPYNTIQRRLLSIGNSP
jgi:hypothetical protein